MIRSLLVLAVLVLACGYREAAADPSASAASARVTLFQDVTRASGIDFVHVQRKGKQLLYAPEMMGPGVGVADYDGDGHYDIFLVQGSGAADAPGTPPPTCKLYRGRGDGTFEDMTQKAGLGVSLWGMGCLWFDYDNDGHPDLFVTAYGEPDRLFHQKADHTFEDVTGKAGLADPAHRWSAGAAALDHDRDGRLDLYVVGYLDFKPADFVPDPPLETIYNTGVNQPATFSPFSYEGLPNKLYRNKGDGTFEDVTTKAGVADAKGKGLGALAVDLDGDAWTDLFVANDVTPKTLYRNKGGGTFEDVARAAWVADVRGSMGLAAGDIDRDGAIDVFCTHWITEPNALYRNNLRYGSGKPGARLSFTEIGEVSGLGSPTTSYVKWGCAFVDLDRDGWQDVMMVNGHTFLGREEPRKLIAMKGMVFMNRGKKKFQYLDLDPEDGLAPPRVGRGLAVADFDEDGFPDVVLTENNGPAAVLRHRGGKGHWLGVHLTGVKSSRDAIGAIVRLQSKEWMQTVPRVSGDSYLSTSWPVAYFGLGEAPGDLTLTVTWPTGTTEAFPVPGIDRVLALTEGTGAPPPASPGR